jgi:hypothetical protein
VRRALLLLLLFLTFPLFADDRLDQALALLNGDEVPASYTPRLKRWPAGGKDLWVVAAVYGWRDQALMHAGVLRETARGFVLVARSDGEEPVSGEPLYSFGLELDLIPYRISPSVTAFGVRIHNSYNSTARASSYDALHLYRLHGKRLVQVFAEVTRETYLEKAQDDSGDDIENITSAVVIVSKKKHKGFFDLVVRDQESRESTTFRWNGERYEPVSGRSH